MRRYGLYQGQRDAHPFAVIAGEEPDRTALYWILYSDDGYLWSDYLRIHSTNRAEMDDLVRVLNADVEEKAIASLRAEVEGGGAG